METLSLSVFLMTLGAGLCSLAVFALMFVVGLVLWQGERGLAFAGGWSPAPANGGWAEPIRKRGRYKHKRSLFQRSTLRSFIGATILTIAVLGFASVIVWIAVYSVTTVRGDEDIRAALHAMRGAAPKPR